MQERNNLVLVILSGIPCAGKTTLSENLKETLYQKYDGAAIITISKDAIRMAKYGKSYDYSKEKEVEVKKEFFKQLSVASSFKRAVIILDNTHCKESTIDYYLSTYKGFIDGQKMQVYIKFLDVPMWKAHLRNVWRKLKTGRWVPLKIMRNKYDNYIKINKEKYKNLIANDF